MNNFKKYIDSLRDDLFKALEIQQATSVALIDNVLHNMEKEFLNVKTPEEQLPPKDKSEEEEDDSFIADDEEELSSYSAGEMEEYVAQHNERTLKNPRKRQIVKPKLFVKEHWDEKQDRESHYCGDVEYDDHDIENIKQILDAIPYIESTDDFQYYITNNKWYQSQFGDVLHEVLENAGKGIHQSGVLFDSIVTNILIDHKYVRAELSKFDRPSSTCSYCGYRKKCDYDYLVNGDKELPLGNKCVHEIMCFIDFFKTLKNDAKKDPEFVLKSLYQIKDNLLSAYKNKKTKF
jgi:hypothetical protein